MLITLRAGRQRLDVPRPRGRIGVPVGAPIHSVVMTNDRVRAPESVESVQEPTVDAIWGRGLTPPEARLLLVMLEPAEGEGAPARWARPVRP